MASVIRELSMAEARRVAQGSSRAEDLPWEWLAASPGGLRALGAFAADAPRGLALTLGQCVLANGEEARFVEVLRVLELAPRRGLRRDGPYVELLRELFAAAAAQTSAPREIAYFWRPGNTEWGLARKLLDVEVVRTETELVRAVDAGPTAAPTGVREVERFDHQARWLWDRCAGAFGASVIRDESFLNWRLVAAPRRPAILGLRDAAGVLRGMLACARRGAALELVDWLVPPEEPAVGEALLDAFLALARASGAARLKALFPDWSPWFEVFQTRGFRVLERGTTLAARTFVRRLDDLWLRDRWWYGGADFALE
jgi:hypothetical protein